MHTGICPRAAVGCVLLVLAQAQEYERSYPPASPECGHQTGYVFETTAWQTGVTQPTNVMMTYGPYATDAPASTALVATWTLWVDDNTADDHELVVLDVHDEASNTVLGELQVFRRDFTAPNTGQAFNVAFTTPAGPSQLEYRVLYLGWSLVTHVATTVAGGGPPSPSPSPPPPVPPVAAAFLYDLTYASSLPLEAGYVEEQLVAAVAGLVTRGAPSL